MAVVACGCGRNGGWDGVGVIAGAEATTDGCVYLAHNTNLDGRQMLNIYNVPAGEDRCASLWFEFPGEAASDSYMNEYGVCLASVGPRPWGSRATKEKIYSVRTAVARKAHSAAQAVEIISRMTDSLRVKDPGRTYLVADQREGWICEVKKGGQIDARRVPDDGIVYVPEEYTPEREGKIHRRDLSLMFSIPPFRSDNTVLTQVFALDRRFYPKKGSIVWVGHPGQFAANQTPWTVGTEASGIYHRFDSAEEAYDKHFSDV